MHCAGFGKDSVGLRAMGPPAPRCDAPTRMDLRYQCTDALIAQYAAVDQRYNSTKPVLEINRYGRDQDRWRAKSEARTCDGCLCPVCPKEGTIQWSWVPGAPICHARRYAKHPIVVAQRRIEKGLDTYQNEDWCPES